MEKRKQRGLDSWTHLARLSRHEERGASMLGCNVREHTG